MGFVSRLLEKLSAQQRNISSIIDFLYNAPVWPIADFIEDESRDIHFEITKADINFSTMMHTEDVRVRISDEQNEKLKANSNRISALILFVKENASLLIAGRYKQQEFPSSKEKLEEELNDLKNNLEVLGNWFDNAVNTTRAYKKNDASRPDYQRGQTDSTPADRLAFAFFRHFNRYGLEITITPHAIAKKDFDSDSQKMLQLWLDAAKPFLPAAFEMPSTRNLITKIYNSHNSEKAKATKIKKVARKVKKSKHKTLNV